MACIKSNDGEKTEVNSIFLPCYLNGYKFSKHRLTLTHDYEKTIRRIVKYLPGSYRKSQEELQDIYMMSILSS